MAKKEDRRTKMTKDFLKRSLIELMKEKNINELSVKEICEKADVNRSTFYKHYSTITGLYEDVISDITENFNIIGLSAKKDGTMFTAKYFESILNYVENNRDLFLVILSKNGNIGFGEFLVQNTDQFIQDENIGELTKYCMYFVVSGMTSIIWKWLNEENRMPAHSVARVISSLLAHGINRAALIASV